MKERIRALCELDAVSGREDAVRAYILDALQKSPAQMEVRVDALGNILCEIRGENRAAKRVLFTAHMDEVGCIVTGITDDGYLRFATVGGVDKSVLCGRRVRIGSQIGIIGCKAVHLCSKKEADTLPEEKDLLIDIGASSAAQAKESVRPGDVAAFDTPFTEMQDMIRAKALDDRIGCALLLKLAETVPPYDISLAFTVQEEVGLRGAAPAAFTLRPDIAVVVETTTAADVGDVPTSKQVCRVGGGPVVSFMDKSTLYDCDLYAKIRTLADDTGIPNQTKTLIAGGNDAGAIQRTGGGVRVAAVSLPCRYIHSPASVVSMRDIEETQRLLSELTKVLPQ